MSFLSELFDVPDPELARNSANCPLTMSFTPASGAATARYVREDAALEASRRDVDAARAEGLAAYLLKMSPEGRRRVLHEWLRQAEQAEDPGCEIVEETVWAEARDPQAAIFALLSGKRVYDSLSLAWKMTGRKPVEVIIRARSKA